MQNSSGPPPPPGLELTPFRGLRYAPSQVSDLSRVISPPYDVIDNSTVAELLAADPHNVVRLIVPRDQPGQMAEVCAEVAAELSAWREDGVLVPDGEPAIYVYEQGTPDGEPLQRGLIAEVTLPPPGSGVVLPHEDVVARTAEGRRMLIEATEANIEPVFFLYDDPAGNETADGERTDGERAPGAATRLAERVTQRQPILDAVTDDGVRHRLWAVTDPAELTEITGDLRGRQALIADGHHRYAAALAEQRRRRAAGDGAGPWDATLALLVDQAAFPPHIGAIHRVVTGLSGAEAAARAKGGFTVTELPELRGGTAPAAVAALATATRTGATAFIATDGEEFFLLANPDTAMLASLTPGKPDSWRAMSAAVRQDLLLGHLWGADEHGERVQDHHDPAEALRVASAHPPAVALFCPPLTAAEIRAVAAAGGTVPRKSTLFTPKPRSGLVMRLFSPAG